MTGDVVISAGEMLLILPLIFRLFDGVDIRMCRYVERKWPTERAWFVRMVTLEQKC